MALSTLALAVDQVAQITIGLGCGPYDPDEVTNLLHLMNAAKNQIDQARTAAHDFTGMIMPCPGSV
jgi:hypothetical protein